MPGLLFAAGALLTWFGYAFALRALYLWLKIKAGANLYRPATIATILAGLTLFAGSEITATKGFHIPLVWVVMPFSAWAAAVSAVFVFLRLGQGLSGLNREERGSRVKAAIIWIIAALLFAWFYRLDPDAKILIIKGSIPLSVATAISLMLLAVGSVAVMVFTARAAHARGIAKTFVIHLALIAGSVLFGLPLLWLVITSFKEDQDMSSPNGIVWIPHVKETTPYFDKDKPYYETSFSGTDVRGFIMSKRPDRAVTLDVERPMAMRGMTVDTDMSKLKLIPTEADLVTAVMDGQKIEGEVVEDMEDGHRKVKALSPAELAGRVQVYAPSDVENIRKVGLRVENYPEALDYLPPEANRGLTYLQNTLIVVVFGILGTILSSAIVAYAFSRMRFPGRNALFSVMLATMMLPGAVTKLPQFMIFKELGWIDTLYPLWVPAFFGSAFNIFMLRQFFKQIPMELEDAAKIDGASFLQTFWSVMMPQIKPALAVIAIFTFVGGWNNFLDPLIYINSPEHMTISYAVQLYSSARGSEPGYLTAFTTMCIAPVLLLFFFAQRYFIEGVTLTGLGGR